MLDPKGELEATLEVGVRLLRYTASPPPEQSGAGDLDTKIAAAVAAQTAAAEHAGIVQALLGDGDPKNTYPHRPFVLGAARSVLVDFESKRIGVASAASPTPRIESDGTGLATMLAYLAGADREVVAAIEADLRETIGITGRVRTLPDELEIEERESIRIDDQLIPRVTRRRVAAHRFEVEVDELGWVPGDLLSEGTLVTLGLLTVLHQPAGPRLILFDDIDQGLHPDAQAKLIAALRKLLAKREDLQIICTTHSPYLLDHVAPEEVQVMSFDEGQVVAARLDQHEDWPKWKGKLQTGEFWQSAGESWVKASERDGE